MKLDREKSKFLISNLKIENQESRRVFAFWWESFFILYNELMDVHHLSIKNKNKRFLIIIFVDYRFV